MIRWFRLFGKYEYVEAPLVPCRDGSSFTWGKVDGHIEVDLDIKELEDKSGISFWFETHKLGVVFTAELKLSQIGDEINEKEH